MTDLDKNLEATWGQAAQHSEYRRGDFIRYQIGNKTFEGTILWIAAQGPSHIQGHEQIPLPYIVVRRGWSGFPDVVLSSDILTS